MGIGPNSVNTSVSGATQPTGPIRTRIFASDSMNREIVGVGV